MDLSFTKNDVGMYVAEFKISGDCNVHIECFNNKPVAIYQRGTSSGRYALVKVEEPSDTVVDFDLNALVYPKWVKIECRENVASAVVTGDAE